MSCYYNSCSIRLLLQKRDMCIELFLDTSPSNAAWNHLSNFLMRGRPSTHTHTRARACAREATRILRVPWPMLRLDNRSGGEVTRPRRYRRESARSAPRNQLERSLKLQVINDASKPVTNPHGSSRQRDTLIISPPSWIIGRIDGTSNYQSPC